MKNNTMKLKHNNFLAKTTAFLLTAAMIASFTAASVDAYNLEANPSNPEVGEEVTISFDASASGGDRIGDMMVKWPRTEFSDNTKWCGAQWCTSDSEFSWTYTPQNSGEKTIEARAENYFGTATDQTSTAITVDSTSSEITVSLDSVSATRYEVSDDQRTQLRATLTNSGTDGYGDVVKVVWRADDGSYSYTLDSTTESVSSDSTETLTSGFLSLNDLGGIGLDRGEEYTLKADYYFDSNGDGNYEDSELVSTAEAPENLVLRQEEGELSLESVGATRDHISESQSTQLQAQVSNSYSTYPREVTVKWYVTGGTYPFYLDEDTVTVQEDSSGNLYSDFLSWEELRNKGLNFGQDYGLEARLFFDGQRIDTATASEDITIQETVENEDPTASFTVSDSNPEAGESVTFDASASSDEDGRIESYEWDFDGDSDVDETTSSATTHHSYSTAGSYRPELTVVDNEEAEASTQRSVDVREPEIETPTIELIQPENGADDVSVTPRFEWSISGPDVDDEKIYVETRDSSSDLPWNQGSSGDVYSVPGAGAFTPSNSLALQDNTEYIWGVQADYSGEQIRSSVYRFNTGTGSTGGGDDDDDDDSDGGNGDPNDGDNGDDDYDRNDRPNVDLRSPSGSIDDRSPQYRWIVSDDDDSDMERVRLVVDDDGQPFSNPLHSRTFRDYDSEADANDVIRFQPPSSWNLERGEEYTWGIDADDGDKSDRETEDFTVEERTRCSIQQNDISFSLSDYTIERGESSRAELTIENDGNRDQSFEYNIELGSETVRERTVTVSAGETRTFSESISPDRDKYVTASISTTGSPCGFVSFSDITREINVLAPTDESASVDVHVEDEDGNSIRNARVEFDGPEDRTRFTDSGGDVGIELEPGNYDITASHPSYESETREDIRLDAGDDRNIEFELERSDGEGTLEVNVLDEDGDGVESRVEVDGPEDRSRLTDNDGFVRFRLDEGSYDIDVDELDGSRSRTGTVYIEEDEVKRRTFVLSDREDGLEITSVDYPDSVCRGDTLSVDYTVRNNEDYDESAQTTASGFDSSIITNTYVVEEGESVSGTLRFTNVQGSGTETFSIRVQNGTSDRISRTVTVEDCAPTEPPRTDSSSISMKLSYPVAPNRALVGDTVKVSGFVDGVTSRTQVGIDVNGDQKARVSTQPDGYYQTFIRMDSVGMKTVTAASGDVSASREIEVLPTASVGYVDAPNQVFEGRSFEVCSEVTSQVDAKVLLLKDGEIVQSTNDREEVCFEVQASEPGTHRYEVRALTTTETSRSTTTVEVLQTDVEVTSFPGQVASVESGSGMVKVELYNTQNDLTRYNLELQGLPSTWSSQTSRQVVLDSGERKTVYFYLTPREEGTYTPELVVDADNQDVYRKEITLEIGGQNQPRSSSFVEKVTGFLGF